MSGLGFVNLPLSNDFQWEQHQDDEPNTLFLCGKVLFLDDKLVCFWMTNWFVFG
jgi:hypothetical protein